MMHKNKCLILFLLIALFLSAVEALNLKKNVDVKVRNGLPSGHNFTIHCKSKNDDMGLHTIGPDQDYAFHFQVNFWRTTLFFCGVKTDYGQGVYDFYKYSRDFKRCRL
ncbi:hypothetical protein SAY87_006464 [Trapa incisa]|uniref:S-protein homolog n=1 Tax=Trapa incisa TaxID=236973 RepID=A0AAN7K0X1_9MYRT|nr:hypothetical protein SAY87_006464 [Trapa incisa]